ncbi:MAG: flagellar biosynthesis protein FlhB [Candidatus Sericytochromatia bacterium]
MSDPSKTEQATPRRRSELRNKGQVARSQELNAAVLFLLALFGLRLFLQPISAFISRSTLEMWRDLPTEMTIDSLMSLFIGLGSGLLSALLPFFGMLMIAGIVVNVAQVGFGLSSKALKPDLGRLNPISGFKRLFSLQPFVQLGQNLVKIGLSTALAWSILRAHYTELLQTVDQPLDSTGVLLGSIVWEIGWKMGVLLLALAAADFAWQRYYFERNIRMSKQEVKDEMRNSEGDPQVKARIRQLQRKAAQNRMMENIPRADVILTNPVHLAVALAYDREAMNAPQVLAKGAAAVAERIKEQAREHQIPILENKPLARALFRSTEVGQEIPADLYSAVSEVLIYVYQLSDRLDEYLE